MIRRLVLPLAALACFSGPALAQSPLPVRVRPPVAAEPDIYNRAAAQGPIVLQVAPGAVVGPLPPGASGLVAIRAVPVAAVSNGGAFGPTGFGYYGDGVSEGPLNRRRGMAEYVLGNRAY